MANYLYKAENSEGKQVVERIDAPNSSTARLWLEYRGYKAIIFQDDDMVGDIQKIYPQNFAATPNYTPEIQLSSMHKSGLWNNLLVQLKMNQQALIPILMFTIFGFWVGSSLLWVAVGIDIFLIVFFAIFLFPKMAFDNLVLAGQWAEWDNVIFYAKLFRFSKKLINLKLHEHDTDVRIAVALAGKGNLDAALNLVKKYENDPVVAKWLYYGRLASVYRVVRDYDKVSECQLLAVNLGPDSAGTLIDYAIGLVRYHKDTVKARELIDLASQKEISEGVSLFLSFCKGIILVEEKNYSEANFHLSEALRKVVPYQNFPGLAADIKAYMAISLAKVGEKQTATTLFEEATPLLIANKETELIKRCEEALA